MFTFRGGRELRLHAPPSPSLLCTHKNARSYTLYLSLCYHQAFLCSNQEGGGALVSWCRARQWRSWEPCLPIWEMALDGDKQTDRTARLKPSHPFYCDTPMPSQTDTQLQLVLVWLNLYTSHKKITEVLVLLCLCRGYLSEHEPTLPHVTHRDSVNIWTNIASTIPLTLRPVTLPQVHHPNTHTQIRIFSLFRQHQAMVP